MKLFFKIHIQIQTENTPRVVMYSDDFNEDDNVNDDILSIIQQYHEEHTDTAQYEEDNGIEYEYEGHYELIDESTYDDYISSNYEELF